VNGLEVDIFHDQEVKNVENHMYSGNGHNSRQVTRILFPKRKRS
jgi:hypothetical protein